MPQDDTVALDGATHPHVPRTEATVKFEDFLGIVIERTEAFREFWSLGHENDPSIWPMEMDEADWWEQFDSFQPEIKDELYGE